MLEKDIEKYLIHKVSSLGGKAYKFTSPNNKGVPDRIVILPNGIIYFIELKNEKGKLSKLQEYQMKTLIELGCNCKVINSKIEVDNFIESLRQANDEF